LAWDAAAPDQAVLAVGTHPDTGQPVLWSFSLALLARGLREPTEDTHSDTCAELEVDDPRWLLLYSPASTAAVGVLLPVAKVERLLFRAAEALATAVDIDALTGLLLGGAV